MSAELQQFSNLFAAFIARIGLIVIQIVCCFQLIFFNENGYLDTTFWFTVTFQVKFQILQTEKSLSAASCIRVYNNN